MRPAHLIAMTILLLANVACTILTDEIEQVDTQTANRTTNVKAALIANPQVDAAAIRVSTDEQGAVVLSGFVESDEQRQAALQAAQATVSPTKVIDQLELR